MSIRLAVSVEGQTEERFVKVVLAPHLAGFRIWATPVIVATSRSAAGTKAKGGGINLDRVVGELRRLRFDYRDGFVTSLYDFYGFRDRQPGEDVAALELRIAQRLGSPPNLIPYVQLHEFEGLLLSDPAMVAAYFKAPALETLVASAVARAGSPERVNDGPNTAPSKRLEEWTREHAPPLLRYTARTKLLHAPQFADHLKLPVIRAACARFDDWVSRLERLRR
ncbi:DUF4276 family protein [Arenibaculum sp.]|uniref:DUF4276 family protein n=1 Tax=Arenibaculum sp. TaxID=2865862 RepID=UPI002E12CD3E|nr:DUF4276 family protein [Arenibaculum sp.]